MSYNEKLEIRKADALETIAEELIELNKKLDKIITFDDPKGRIGSISVRTESI